MVDVPPKIARSRHRKEIDQMLSDGDTYTAISNWLKNNGEDIGRNVISKYHKFCFNINDKAAELYTQIQSEAKLYDEASKVVSSLELYDKYIEAGAKINPEVINDDKMADLAMKAAKQKEDFLREHGNQEAELQSQLLKEILDELRMQDLNKLIEGMSNERTKKRINQAAIAS